MKVLVLWIVLALAMGAGLIFTHAGLVTFALSFLGWVGGIVSLALYQRMGRPVTRRES